MSSLNESRVLRQRREKKDKGVAINKKEKKSQNNVTSVMEEVDDTLIPEKVIGALRNSNNEVCLIVKWKNKESTDTVPASIANYRFPNLVIRYYEQRIRWIDV
ncbi:Chromobox -like protein 3 [Leptotrombidium deliense]|uniref:Chromobox-like protein 3 n=1 Tax=Leptotrombidium deliense TaxID=299467 RepID=A0A443S835_9ACAR|nr:Chromobox -like protein 3 [Leptotrombidium deliense]